MLESDVTLYSNQIDLIPRLSRSNGTEFSNALEPYTKCYYDGYIPKQPWLPLTTEESKILIAQSPPQSHINSIGVGKIPVEIFKLAGMLNIDSNKLHNYIDLNSNNPHHLRFKQALLDYLEPHCINQEGITPLPIYCGRKNLATTTFDFHKQLFIGLHYDNWDEVAWTKRKNVRNRICINLGIEERYFLFINLELKNVLQKLNNLDMGTYPLNEGPYRPFFKKYADYPVIRLRLEPGEYYIAPTENIMHDGCTENKVYHDVIMTVLGYFHTRGLT
ncbi:MAG: hypothetical protein V4501_01635 [Pseudomonadota bacterium]